jgi:hypothetical protein
LRKTPTIVLGLAATLAMAGGAVAQTDAPSHTSKVTISPSKAGTKTKPKAVSTKLTISNSRASGTTAKRIEIFFDKNIRMSPKGFPLCSASKVENDGSDACPSGSKLGTGTAGAVVNPTGAGGKAPTPLAFKNTFFVGSSKSLTIFLEQTNGDVRAILVGKISKASGKYGQKLSIDIPENLQQPAPDVYSALTDIATSLKGTTGSGSKKHGFFESLGCTGGKYSFQTRITYAPNPTAPSKPSSTNAGTGNCKK